MKTTLKKVITWAWHKSLVMLSLRANKNVCGIDIKWNIKQHPTDLSNAMKAEDCRFIGTYEECIGFLFARNGA